MVKAVVFDFDGVIINSFLPAFKRHREIAKKIRLTPPPLKIFRKHFGKKWEEQFIPALSIELNWPKGMLGKFIDEYKKGYEQLNYPLIPGAKETLLTLHKLKINLAIISNREVNTLELRLRRANIDQTIFFQQLTPENSKFHKPDPRVFDPLLEKLKQQKGILPTEVVYVGDTVRYDMKAAKNHNPPLHFIGITSGATAKKEFLRAGLEEKFIISSLEEIIPIIKSL